MNPLAFGYDCWTWMHQMPWLYPHEVLTVDEAVALCRGLQFTAMVNPCPKCRNSAIFFVRRAKPLGTCRLSCSLHGTYYTRTEFAKKVWELHETVNKKLERKPFPGGYLDSIVRRDDWVLAMCNYLLAIAYNYPERDPPDYVVHLYQCYLEDVMPTLLAHTPQGAVWRGHLESQGKVPLRTRAALVEWTHGLVSELLPPMWDEEMVRNYFIIMKARNSTECQTQWDQDIAFPKDYTEEEERVLTQNATCS